MPADTFDGASGGRLDVWQPIADGCRLMSTGGWLVLPALLPLPAVGTFGTVAAILLGASSAAHWFALRDIERGLLPCVGESDGSVALLRRARLHAHLYALCGVGMSLYPLVTYVVAPSFSPPSLYRFVMLAILAPLLVAGFLLARAVGLLIAQASGVDAALPERRAVSLHLWTVGPAYALSWILVAASFALPASAADRLYGGAMWSAILLGLWMIWLLFTHIELFAKAAVAVPQSPTFNEAARRIARREPLRVPHEPEAPLPPIELAERPAPPT